MKGIDVFRAVEDNDVANVVKILEMFGFKKDGTNPHFTYECRDIMTLLLSAASAVAAGSDSGHLDYGMANELVERTSKAVNIFKFLKLVATAMRFESDNYDIIPDPVRSALSKNDPSYVVERAIDDLSPDAFEAMISLLLSEGFEQLNVRFAPPIIRYIYENQVLSDDLMFAFMAACPRRTVEEFLSSINPFDAFAMLHLSESMADDGKTDDEDSNNKAADEACDDSSGGGWAL